MALKAYKFLKQAHLLMKTGKTNAHCGEIICYSHKTKRDHNYFLYICRAVACRRYAGTTMKET